MPIILRCLALFRVWALVDAISANPRGSYSAVTTYTNDGGQQYERKVTGLVARMVGGEVNPTEETLEGYTVVYNPTLKRYEYAEIYHATGDYAASGVPVERGMPPDATRFPKHLRRTDAGIARISKTPDVEPTARHLLAANTQLLSLISQYDLWNSRLEDVHRHQLLATANGVTNLKLLVIPLTFANHTATRWLPSKQQLETLFNNVGPDPFLAPNGTVRDAFLQQSFGKLDVTATVVDWIPLNKTEAYYAGGVRGYKAVTMHTAIKAALDLLEASNFDFKSFDQNNDGLIDGICFLHSGYGAEFGGISQDKAYFMDRIWSHTWNLSSLNNGNGWTSAKTGVKVFNYPIVSSLYGNEQKTSGNRPARIGALVHELSNFLGLDADLGDRSTMVGYGLGIWDITFDAWGFDGSQRCVAPLNPYSKLSLGWLSARDISAADSGSTMTLNSSQSVVLRSQEGFPNGEFLLMEYRNGGPCSPINGLAVWHVDEQTSSFATPSNHYRVALVQADGNSDLEQGRNSGNAGDLFSSNSHLSTPITDAYSGTPTRLTIDNIVLNDNSLSMHVIFDEPTAAPTTPAPSKYVPPTKSPTLSPTSSPTSGSPTNAPTTLSPTSFPTASPTISMAPTPKMPDSCSDTAEALFEFELRTDEFGSETTWELRDALRGPAVMAKGGPYMQGEKKVIRLRKCLEKMSCWSLVIRDSAGNGIQGTGNGYTVKWNGAVEYATKALADGSLPLFDETGVDFGDMCRVGPLRNVQYLSQHGDFISSAMMFDVKGKMSSMLMRFTRLHLKSTVGDVSVTYKVYTKNGSYQGYETDPSAWTLVKTQAVIPKGMHVWTQAENWDVNLPLMEGTTQALYIELDQRVLFSTDCTKEGLNATGQVHKSFDEMDVLSGVISNPGFGGIEPGKIACMEGKITVSPIELLPAITQEPSPSPSGVPSPSPSRAPSSLPSSSPTISVMPSYGPTANPTFSPTVSSAPTLSLPQTCPPGEKLFVIEVKTDLQGRDTTWILTDALRGPAVKATGGPYRNQLSKRYKHGECLAESSCWSIAVHDAKGDGIQNVAGGNGYKFTWGGTVIDQSKALSNGSSPKFNVVGADFGEGCRANTLRHNEEMGRGGTVSSSAMMFDMYARQSTIVIRFAALNIDVPSDGSAVTLKVYTKNGSYQGYETDASAWRLVTTQTIVPAGKGTYTTTSNFDGPRYAPIMAGTTQAFYIELDKPVLITTRGGSPSYTNITAPGLVYESFPAVDLMSGVIAKPAFGGVTEGSVALLDGKLTLSTIDLLDFASMVPSASPTRVPSARPSAAPSSKPSAKPSISSRPSMAPSTPAPTAKGLGCAPHEGLFTMFLQTDDFGSENTWKITNVRNGGMVMASGGPYPDFKQKTYRKDVCLHAQGCYKFVLSDSKGDGLQGAGRGFRAVWKGKVQSDTITTGKLHPSFSNEGVDFGDKCLVGPGRQSLLIGNNGATASYGTMFDVKGINDIIIMRFATINTLRLGVTYNAKVYSKNGSYKGFETDSSAWTLVSEEAIVGGGQNSWTYMNNFNRQYAPVLGGTRQAFYIVLNVPELITEKGSVVGITAENQVYKRFTDFELLSGIIVGKDFTGKVPGSGVALLDGRIAYADVEIALTPPTATPSRSPSTRPSARPSARPSISHHPTMRPTTASPTAFHCPINQSKLRISVRTDANGSQNSWQVVDVWNKNAVLYTKGPFTNEIKDYRYDLCVVSNSCYKFVITDSAGNGITGAGNGFKVEYDNKVEIDTMKFPNAVSAFSVDGVDFGSSCLPDGGYLNTIGVWSDGGSYGQMFDVKGKQDTVWRRFNAVNLSTGTYNFKVYTKNGSYKGYENNASAWTLVGQQTVIGAGKNLYTVIDNFLSYVPVMAGTTQAFYVLVDKPELQYGNGNTRGFAANTVYKTFTQFDMITGVSFNSPTPFTGTPIPNVPIMFSGRVTYGTARVAV